MPLNDILSRHKDLGKTKYCHEILVNGSDFEVCKKKVLHFFENYQLVRYSSVQILENESLSASNQGFEERLQKAILKNRLIIHNLIRELQTEAISTLDDLKDLPQGYKSKMLHVITHFLDGFFGIDTYFFNLADESHWITGDSRQKITDDPSHYWMLTIEAII